MELTGRSPHIPELFQARPPAPLARFGLHRPSSVETVPSRCFSSPTMGGNGSVPPGVRLRDGSTRKRGNTEREICESWFGDLALVLEKEGRSVCLCVCVNETDSQKQ